MISVRSLLNVSRTRFRYEICVELISNREFFHLICNTVCKQIQSNQNVIESGICFYYSQWHLIFCFAEILFIWYQVRPKSEFSIQDLTSVFWVLSVVMAVRRVLKLSAMCIGWYLGCKELECDVCAYTAAPCDRC